MKRFFFITVAFVAVTAMSSAQSFQRRASMTNHASGDREKCTIEVVVDGAAEVEIRGDSAALRNVSGRPPQWRRFECSAPMPPDPPNFRFQGVDGRGRQQLVRDPRGGGPAVVRIEDPDNGSEGYTFDITWGGGSSGRPSEPPPYLPQGGGRRFTVDQAIAVCRDAVREQAMERFRTSDIRFPEIRIDDNPGRNDWVIGVMDIRFRDDRRESYRFSCSVDFGSGRVRSADIQRFEEPRGGRGPGPSVAPGIEACQRAVEDRLRNDGYDRITVRSIRADDRPGGADRVMGSADAEGRYRRPDSFDFSCVVNLERGVVRSVDLNSR